MLKKIKHIKILIPIIILCFILCYYLYNNSNYFKFNKSFKQDNNLLSSNTNKYNDFATSSTKSFNEIITKLKRVDPVSLNTFNGNNLTYSLIGNSDYNKDIVFQNNYSKLKGIPTFRGNNYRNSASYGTSKISSNELKTSWKFTTSSSTWGGGAGWTGQPAIIKWPESLKKNMNIDNAFKEKEDFTEVIYASLDGNVYFLDIDTGKPSRPKINVGNPIKGSVSIDPRGIPLLYVGEGINEKDPVGFNIYSLINGEKLFELNGNDPDAPRNWPAFDSSAIISSETDSVILGGENGLLYILQLNSNYDMSSNKISIDPKLTKYKYDVTNSRGRLGIENSVATYANLVYFADNNGYIQCVDLNTLKPVWLIDGSDDIDASLTVDIEDNVPFIYCGNEVDHQGTKGISKTRKINGLTGEIIWEKDFSCESIIGDDAVNGGAMSTNIIGKNKISDKVIFSLARCDGFNKGVIASLNKSNGEISWQTKIDNYMWSSPVDFYNKNGDAYIIQCDSAGNVFLIDGLTGKILNKIVLDANIEASPALFEDKIVIATRSGSIYKIDIN